MHTSCVGSFRKSAFMNELFGDRAAFESSCSCWLPRWFFCLSWVLYLGKRSFFFLGFFFLGFFLGGEKTSSFPGTDNRYLFQLTSGNDACPVRNTFFYCLLGAPGSKDHQDKKRTGGSIGSTYIAKSSPDQSCHGDHSHSFGSLT